MDASEPLLRFKRATLGYGRSPILTGLDLAIERRSFVGILGHNGSGKTTLLKTVLGLIEPLKGRLVREGPAPIRFGYVPQKEKLDPIYPLTAYDVAAMGAFRKLELLRRLRGLDTRPLVEQCLAACGASALAERRYSDLSGGQRQRVLIARALAAEPDVLALDEPLAGIDATTQKAIIKLLRQLKEERGLTVLMVSHRIQVERELFTHVLLCDQGEAVIGPSEEMLAGGKLKEMFRQDA
ncbi:MAG: metal ABC transporter ATP-binding protein [Elusimicrobia bacterium]|nr:metal ABC transporter ATP-binding protein [Elusimicrobiota bacterium]